MGTARYTYDVKLSIILFFFLGKTQNPGHRQKFFAYYLLDEQVISDGFEVRLCKMSEEASTDEVAKYKRVLSLARSSLEANQATIAAKDQQISQLIKALEEEKANNKIKRVIGKDEEAALIPRKILCRVDVDDQIWILVEYDDFDDCWKRLDSEQDLDDFIQRIPGVPLVCPPRCLSMEESSRIVSILSFW